MSANKNTPSRLPPAGLWHDSMPILFGAPRISSEENLATPTYPATPTDPATPTETETGYHTERPLRSKNGEYKNGTWYCTILLSTPLLQLLTLMLRLGGCDPPVPALKRFVRKPGPNNGRWFYRCHLWSAACDFFLWKSEAEALLEERSNQSVEPEPVKVESSSRAPEAAKKPKSEPHARMPSLDSPRSRIGPVGRPIPPPETAARPTGGDRAVKDDTQSLALSISRLNISCVCIHPSTPHGYLANF